MSSLYTVPKFDIELPPCTTKELPQFHMNVRSVKELQIVDFESSNPWAMSLLRERGFASDHPFGPDINHRKLQYPIFSTPHMDDRGNWMPPLMKTCLQPGNDYHFSSSNWCSFAPLSVSDGEWNGDQTTLNMVNAPELGKRDMMYIHSNANPLRFPNILDLKRACQLIGHHLTNEEGNEPGGEDGVTLNMLFRFFVTLCNTGPTVNTIDDFVEWIKYFKLDRIYGVDHEAGLQVNIKRLGQLMRCLQRIRCPFFEGQHRESSIGFAAIGYYHASNQIKVKNARHTKTVDEYAMSVNLDPDEIVPMENQAFSRQHFSLGIPPDFADSTMKEALRKYTRYGESVTVNNECNVKRTAETLLMGVLQDYQKNPTIEPRETYLWNKSLAVFERNWKNQKIDIADKVLTHITEKKYQKVIANKEGGRKAAWDDEKTPAHIHSNMKANGYYIRAPTLSSYTSGLTEQMGWLLAILKYACVTERTIASAVRFFHMTEPVWPQADQDLPPETIPMSRRISWVADHILGPAVLAIKHLQQMITCEKQFLGLAQSVKWKHDPDVIKVLKSAVKDFSKCSVWVDTVLEMTELQKKKKRQKGDDQSDTSDIKDSDFPPYCKKNWGPFNKRILDALSEHILQSLFDAYSYYGLNPKFNRHEFYLREDYDGFIKDKKSKFPNDAVRCMVM